MKTTKVSQKLSKQDLLIRTSNALGRIFDEAWHALDTEADKPVEVLRKNMQAIKKISGDALKELRNQW